MSDNQKPCAATPNATLEEQIVSSCVPKNEREWWAHHEILRQRQRIAQLEAEVVKWQEAYYNDQRTTSTSST